MAKETRVIDDLISNFAKVRKTHLLLRLKEKHLRDSQKNIPFRPCESCSRYKIVL